MISPSLKLIVLGHIFHSVMHEKTIFKNNPDLINYVTSHLDTKIYQPEMTILNQGEEAKNLYFIARGNCNVYVRLLHRKTEEKVNKIIGSGDFFGEIALITGGKRTATVRTENYCTTSHITFETF